VNFLADENIDRQIVETLRLSGHDVRYVAEMEPGITDEIVIERAVAEGLVILTADKDFGEYLFHQGRTWPGTILLRLSGISSATRSHLVATIVNRHGSELEGAFAVVTPGMLRIRHDR